MSNTLSQKRVAFVTGASSGIGKDIAEQLLKDGLVVYAVVIEPGAIQTEFGNIVAGPMMQRSGQSAYSELAKKMEVSMKQSSEKGGASPPSVITDLVSKALKAKRPKTRYVAGKYAKPMLFLRRRWFGDRIYDKAVMSLPS